MRVCVNCVGQLEHSVQNNASPPASVIAIESACSLDFVGTDYTLYSCFSDLNCSIHPYFNICISRGKASLASIWA